ncbi:MAG TPA: hypothetical protein VHX86_06855 [Tepidisphaeraceae bacterium]|nr:hypothetical protein [Tepidisphaeraceae bacterium]
MKQPRHKKVLGIALGERSLLAAELIAAERPQVKRLAELVYPEGISFSQPEELAKVLAHFLKDNQFSTRTAVIGIPLKWLVVKAKEVPPANDATVAQLLRLEAEAEFSTELKDLVYDFSGTAPDASHGDASHGEASRSVLLIATQKKYIDSIEILCEGARLQPLAVMPSAIALGSLTGSSLKRDVLVLSVGSGGAELSSQRQSSATAMRSLRAASSEPPFVNELRRAVSTLALTGTERELVLWDGAGMNTVDLGERLGVTIRSGELHSLGVDATEAGANGQGAKYAAAVALALSVLDDTGPGVDFLHSRLAPPREHRIPRWAYIAAAVLVVVIGICIYAYSDLERRQKAVDDLQSQIAKQQSTVDAARDFVSKVSLAQYWHIGEARYLACMRDLDDVIPEDGQTYATSLEIKAQTPPVTSGASSSSSTSVATLSASADEARILFVTLQGHTANLESVTALVERMRHNPTAFKDIKIGPGTKVPRTQEWLFSITFSYVPSKTAGTTSGQTK